MVSRRLVYCILVVLAATLLGSSTVAETIAPTYDIGGIWSNGRDPGGSHFFQNGDEVKTIYVNRGFTQFFSGKYVSATIVEGVWLRKNRSNGCVTKVKERLSVVSTDTMNSEWEVLDSNCDLQKGKSGTDTLNRQKAAEDKLWY
ncbi:MAG: hypothetical protein ABSA59_01315 [Terriglobia bacterium]|jgi:hypothetical protein